MPRGATPPPLHCQEGGGVRWRWGGGIQIPRVHTANKLNVTKHRKDRVLVISSYTVACWGIRLLHRAGSKVHGKYSKVLCSTLCHILSSSLNFLAAAETLRRPRFLNSALTADDEGWMSAGRPRCSRRERLNSVLSL